MEAQNLVISFDYSWFLAKNLAYDECPIMKFHHRNSSTPDSRPPWNEFVLVLHIMWKKSIGYICFHYLISDLFVYSELKSTHHTQHKEISKWHGGGKKGWVKAGTECHFKLRKRRFRDKHEIHNFVRSLSFTWLTQK